MRRKGVFRKGNTSSDNLLYTSISNYFLKGDNLMTNYRRQALKQHYKRRLENLKKKIVCRVPLFTTPEVHIVSVMDNRALPSEVSN